MAKGALSGIKVAELATMVSGPYCGKLLADMGADVIKVEPAEGDPSRQCGPFPKSGPHPEHSATFLYNNTSKRGITLNLTKAEGLDVFKRLLRWADVLIDNHPPRYLENLGLNGDSIHQINQSLIYTSITPYGRSGPRANDKGDELTISHASGMGNLLPTRSEDVNRAPVKMGGYAAGYHGGITAALATLAAILGRVHTRRGRLIDISLQEVILSVMRVNVATSRYQDATWSRVPDRPPTMGRMETSDGYVVIGTPEDHHFRAFQEIMGNPEWLKGEEWESLAYRTHHLMDVKPELEEWMQQQQKDEIHHRAAKKGIAVGPINSTRDVMANKQYAARDYFTEVEHPDAGKYRYAGWPYKMTATPPRVSRPAPLLGQHNEEICCGVLGYSPEEYEHLRNTGVV